jgi:hypothetical protein
LSNLVTRDTTSALRPAPPDLPCRQGAGFAASRLAHTKPAKLKPADYLDFGRALQLLDETEDSFED